MKESRFPAPKKRKAAALDGIIMSARYPLVPLASLDLPSRDRRVAFGFEYKILLEFTAKPQSKELLSRPSGVSPPLDPAPMGRPG
jgi:hypothetical protein